MKEGYNFFKNSKYAFEGVFYAFKNEMAFVIELCFVFIFSVLLIFLNLELLFKALLFSSMLLVLIVELLNSGIEKTVDLVTLEFHPLAKAAKDLASAAVFFSISNSVILWLVAFYYILK